MSVLESVDGLHTSPFEVIPKGHQTGKWRLIVDLSSPHGESVNDGIDKELCMLSYISVYDIVKTILTLIKGALMAKVDIKKTPTGCYQYTQRIGYCWAWSGKGRCTSTQPCRLDYAQRQRSSWCWRICWSG